MKYLKLKLNRAYRVDLLYFNVGSLRDDNCGVEGNAKYASFFCLFSEFKFLSSLLALVPN